MTFTKRLSALKVRLGKIAGNQPLIIALAFASAGSIADAQTDQNRRGSPRQEISHTEPARAERSILAERIDFTQMTKLSVHVKDPNGEPVQGALVKPVGLRVVERNGTGFWNEAKLGSPKAVVSNERGLALIQYPAYVEGAAHGYRGVLTTRSVAIHILHSDFVKQVVHCDLKTPSAEITLEPGCEAQLSAVDDQVEPITEFGVLMAGPFAAEIWTNDLLGGKRTRSIKDGKWQTMLVKLQDNAPPLFSSILPIPFRPTQTVKIRNIQLSPGSRIVGRISNDVPRPIRHGRIIAAVVPKPAAASSAPEDPSLVWHDSASVSSDGEFEFPSLPRGGEAQIIALCDGWISKTTMEEARDYLIMGQLIALKERQVSIVVEMERLGSLEVALASTGGGPVVGARVTTWPNQTFYKNGTAILGQSLDSRTIVANQSLPLERQFSHSASREEIDRFSAVTDRDGKATIRNLPIRQKLTLTIMHPEFWLPLKNGEAVQSFVLSGPNAQKLNIFVEPLAR